MSLRERLFGKREPIQRHKGVDSLVKEIGGFVHKKTAKIWDVVKEESPDEDQILVVLAANLYLWSLIIDELCKHAQLWAPSQPQQFTDQVLTSVVRYEWGNLTEADDMAGSLLFLLRGLREDREEEEAGRIEEGTSVFRAADRPIDIASKSFPDFPKMGILKLALVFSQDYPVGATVNRAALEAVGALRDRSGQ